MDSTHTGQFLTRGLFWAGRARSKLINSLCFTHIENAIWTISVCLTFPIVSIRFYQPARNLWQIQFQHVHIQTLSKRCFVLTLQISRERTLAQTMFRFRSTPAEWTSKNTFGQNQFALHLQCFDDTFLWMEHEFHMNKLGFHTFPALPKSNQIASVMHLGTNLIAPIRVPSNLGSFVTYICWPTRVASDLAANKRFGKLLSPFQWIELPCMSCIENIVSRSIRRG